MRSGGTDAPKEDRVRSVEQRVMAGQGEQTLSGGNEQTRLMNDAQRTMTLACGHECTMYAGMMSTSGCLSKRRTKCCECMHTATESPCIYIDGLGERPCPRWQFYCAACIHRCAPDDGTVWDAGKMTRVPVFEPGTRTLMSAVPERAVAQAAVASRANVAMAAPSAWLDVARQTLHDIKQAEQEEPAEPQVVPPRQVAAATSRTKARKPQAAAVPSQPTARKPRRPALVCDEETPCTHHAHAMHPTHLYTACTPRAYNTRRRATTTSAWRRHERVGCAGRGVCRPRSRASVRARRGRPPAAPPRAHPPRPSPLPAPPAIPA